MDVFEWVGVSALVLLGAAIVVLAVMLRLAQARARSYKQTLRLHIPYLFSVIEEADRMAPEVELLWREQGYSPKDGRDFLRRGLAMMFLRAEVDPLTGLRYDKRGLSNLVLFGSGDRGDIDSVKVLKVPAGAVDNLQILGRTINAISAVDAVPSAALDWWDQRHLIGDKFAETAEGRAALSMNSLSLLRILNTFDEVRGVATRTS